MFRIKMAIALFEEKGNTFDKDELGRLLWVGANKNSVRVNMSNLINGKISTFRPEWIPIICEKLDCTTDFLFGIEKTKKDEY